MWNGSVVVRRRGERWEIGSYEDTFVTLAYGCGVVVRGARAISLWETGEVYVIDKLEKIEYDGVYVNLYFGGE